MDSRQSAFAWIRAILIATVIVPSILTLAACSKQPTRLTEKWLHQLHETGMAAAAKQDTKAICALYADDAEIRLTTFTRTGSDKKTYGKEEYCALMEFGYAQMKAAGMSSTMKADITDMEIAADGKSADVHSTVTESLRIQGQSINVRTEQSDRVELMGGKPLITKTVAIVKGAS